MNACVITDNNIIVSHFLASCWLSIIIFRYDIIASESKVFLTLIIEKYFSFERLNIILRENMPLLSSILLYFPFDLQRYDLNAIPVVFKSSKYIISSFASSNIFRRSADLANYESYLFSFDFKFNLDNFR